MDTTKLFSIAMIVLIGTMGMGVVALAVDFTWDGGSTTDNNWTTVQNWIGDSGYPDDGNDNATIEDVTPKSTCTFDSQSAITINNLAVAGDSPTRMNLNVKDATLTVDGVATFGDYAALDVDQNLTIDDTDMSGHIWVDVADSTTLDLGTTVDIVGSTVAASGISCNLHLVDNTSGTFKGATVTIDADTPDLTRGFKFSSSGSTFDVLVEFVLISDQTSGTKKAKLWIEDGTINIADASATNGVLDVDGGNAASRRVDIDIDDILTTEETQFAGYVGVDVASGKTATGGDVIFEDEAIVVKTGSGTFRSGA